MPLLSQVGALQETAADELISVSLEGIDKINNEVVTCYLDVAIQQSTGARPYRHTART
jgi:hypothetical protein